jgi:hypothetical protein
MLEHATEIRIIFKTSVITFILFQNIFTIIFSIYPGLWTCPFNAIDSFIWNHHPYVDRKWINFRNFSKSFITPFFFIIFSNELKTILLQTNIAFVWIKKFYSSFLCFTFDNAYLDETFLLYDHHLNLAWLFFFGILVHCCLKASW